MTEQIQTPEAESTPEKKKFYRNPKVVAGTIVAAVAAGVALVIHGQQKDDSVPDEDEAETVEKFDRDSTSN